MKLSGFIWILLCTLLTVSTTLIVYFPGLDGSLIFDDLHTVKNNLSIRITSLTPAELVIAMESFTAGGRQLSMLSFALNHHFFGDSTWWFKFINLIIHCFNGLLLITIGKLLVEQYVIENSALKYKKEIAIIVAASSIWFVSPINLTSVLYVSQRMTLLSSTFILLGILSYILGRNHIQTASRRYLYLPLIIGGFTFLAYLCKENGALLPLYIAAIECILFRFKNQGSIDRTISTLAIIGLILGVIAVGYVFMDKPEILFGGYKMREFSLEERLLTQLRALSFYIGQIIVPSNMSLGLFHDDFAKSTGLLQPISTLLAGIFLIFIGLVAVVLNRRLPLFSFGIAWFAVSHALESTIIPLEMIHEHRNYLASFGILIAVSCILSTILNKRRALLLAILSSWFIYNSTVLAERARIWSDKISLLRHEVAAHPNSAIAHYSLASTYLTQFSQANNSYNHLIEPLLLKILVLKPNQVDTELVLTVAGDMGAIEYDPKWIKQAIEKFPTAHKNATTEVAIFEYIKCLGTERCKKSYHQAKYFFNVISETGHYRYKNLAANYYTNVLGDFDRASTLYSEILRYNDATIWVGFLNSLLQNNEYQNACNRFSEFHSLWESKRLHNSAANISSVSRIVDLLKHCN